MKTLFLLAGFTVFALPAFATPNETLVCDLSQTNFLVKSIAVEATDLEGQIEAVTRMIQPDHHEVTLYQSSNNSIRSDRIFLFQSSLNIGQSGVETFLVREASGQYHLESVSEGRRVRVSESFSCSIQ